MVAAARLASFLRQKFETEAMATMQVNAQQ
jgi:hypothetical protein